MNKAEEYLIKFLSENVNTSYCSRENAKSGCLKCQEFYRLLDQYASEVSQEEKKQHTIEFAKFFFSISADDKILVRAYDKWLTNQNKAR